MSKVQIKGNASGTGIFTIAAPNTNTDYSITLPTSSATLATTAAPDFTGDVTFDTSTLVVDSTNNRVGIGTASPEQLLDVRGRAQIKNDVPVLYFNDTDGTNQIGSVRQIAGSGLFISSRDNSSHGNIKFTTDNGTVETLRMIIDSGGRVGIGIDTPQERLTLSSGDSGSCFLQVVNTDTGEGNDEGLYVGLTTADQGYVGTRSNHALLLETNNTTAITIDTSQRVGIGTSSPSYKLHVNNTASDAVYINVNSSGSNDQNAIRLAVDDVLKAQLGVAIDAGRIGSSSAANDFVLKSYGNIHLASGTGATNLFVDNTNNRIGIGTTSPSQELHIEVGNGGNVTSGTGLEGAVIQLKHNQQWESGYGTGGGNPDFLGGIEFATSDSSTGQGVRTAIKTTVDTYYNSNSLVFYTAPGNTAGVLERMRITSGGDVGIGTNNPGDYGKLTVRSTGSGFDVTEGITVIGYGTGNQNDAGTIGFGAGADLVKAAIGFTRNNSYGRGYLGFYVDSVGDYNDVSTADEVMRINSDNVIPGADAAYDLGTSSARWNNIYTTDLHLSNRGKQNEVDGTWGDWTLQEGENDIYMINHRTGKKYKMMLSEVE